MGRQKKNKPRKKAKVRLYLNDERKAIRNMVWNLKVTLSEGIQEGHTPQYAAEDLFNVIENIDGVNGLEIIRDQLVGASWILLKDPDPYFREFSEVVLNKYDPLSYLVWKADQETTLQEPDR